MEPMNDTNNKKVQWGLGTKVSVLVDFSGVPKGTEGYVVEDYGSGYMIAWDLPNKPYPHHIPAKTIGEMWAVNHECPLRDGFDKRDELNYLKILELVI